MKLTAVDVRQVVAAHTALGVGQQRLGDQLGAEERATDADVDHVGDRFFAVAAPQAVVDAAYQFGDLVEHLVHFRHDVHAVDAEFVTHRPTQGGVQHRAPFGGVDDFATEHGLDGVLQAHFVGQVHQQVAALFGDQVFRVVEEQAAGTQGELVEALGIGGERFAHAEALHGVAVLLERLPGGQGRDIVGCTVIRHCAGFPWCVVRPWTRHSLPGSGWHHYRQRPLAGNG